MNPPSRHRPEALDQRFARFRATRDISIRNALVEDFSWLASYCARRFAHRGEPREDLVQVALVGLVNAVNRFDPERGVSFSTFAVPTIDGELRRHFRDKTWAIHVTRRLKDDARNVSSAVDDLTASLGRTPTVAEIAVRTDLVEEDVLEALEAPRLQRGATLDERDDEEGHHAGHLGVIDRGYEAVEARTVLAELLEVVPTARDRRIVALRFVDGCSQSEIAAEVGVSQVQVSRLLRANLERMRRAASWQRHRLASGSAPAS